MDAPEAPLPGPDGVNRDQSPQDKDELLQDKALLRDRLLAGRRQLTPAERAGAGRDIRDAVLSLPETQMAGTVAAYYSIGSEPETHGLLFALWKRGSYVLLPLLLPDGDLDWASYEGPDSLRPGPRWLTEPTEPRAGPARSPARTWCWCPRSPSTTPACGSAAAAAATTGPWPGSEHKCRPWRCSTTASSSLTFQRDRMTSGFA